MHGTSWSGPRRACARRARSHRRRSPMAPHRGRTIASSMLRGLCSFRPASRHRHPEASPRPQVLRSGNSMSRCIRGRTCIALLLSALAGCRSPSPGDVPKAVFVSPGARELRVSDGVARSQIDVAYVADEKYPAPGIREGLARALRDSGYQPLDHDFLEPSQKTEVPRDWSSYNSGRQTCVREVVEDWQNTQGDVVRYSLRYDSPCEAGPVRRDEPTAATLKVTVGMIPAAAATAMREAARQVTPGRQ